MCIYIYIYIYVCVYLQNSCQQRHVPRRTFRKFPMGVRIPPLGLKIPLESGPLTALPDLVLIMTNTKPGAGEEFVLVFCRAEARAKGVFCSKTLVAARDPRSPACPGRS